MKLPPGVSKEKFDEVLRNLLNNAPMPLSSISPKRGPKAKQTRVKKPSAS